VQSEALEVDDFGGKNAKLSVGR